MIRPSSSLESQDSRLESNDLAHWALSPTGLTNWALLPRTTLRHTLRIQNWVDFEEVSRGIRQQNDAWFICRICWETIDVSGASHFDNYLFVSAYMWHRKATSGRVSYERGQGQGFSHHHHHHHHHSRNVTESQRMDINMKIKIKIKISRSKSKELIARSVPKSQSQRLRREVQENWLGEIEEEMVFSDTLVALLVAHVLILAASMHAWSCKHRSTFPLNQVRYAAMHLSQHQVQASLSTIRDYEYHISSRR